MNLDALQSKNALSGLLFLAVGLVGTALSLGLPVGDRIRMGPGYIPLALSIGLSGLGTFILARGLLSAAVTAEAWRVRPVMFVVASALVFGLTVERIGLLLSVFLTVLTASAALSEWRRAEALILAAGLSLFSVLLFVMMLRLPIPALP
jgi:hypothetical protein